MDITIRTDSNGVTTVWQGGRLLAECVLSHANDRDQLAAEVVRARRLSTLPRIIEGAMKELLRAASLPSEGLSSESKRVEWCMGFEDGWNLLEVPIPQTDPTQPTKARPSALVHRHTGKSDRGTCTNSFVYKLGYEWGEAMRKVVDVTKEANCSDGD